MSSWLHRGKTKEESNSADKKLHRSDFHPFLIHVNNVRQEAAPRVLPSPEPDMTSLHVTAQSCHCTKGTLSRLSPKKATVDGGRGKFMAG